MKDQRHKRKETFSVLVISNTDRSSRQFQISLFSVRLVFSVLLILLVVLGLLGYQFFAGYKKRDALQGQLASQKEQTQQLEEEVKELQQAVTQAEEKVQVQKVKAEPTMEPSEDSGDSEDSEDSDEDSTFPSLYPSQGSNVLRTGFTAEQPYISVIAHAGGSVVAAADGTIIAISSDDTYSHIIEIQHENGYTTRYMCHQEGEVTVTQGAQVQQGDILINIITDSTQLDYQVIYEGAPMDPFMLIDAKG